MGGEGGSGDQVLLTVPRRPPVQLILTRIKIDTGELILEAIGRRAPGDGRRGRRAAPGVRAVTADVGGRRPRKTGDRRRHVHDRGDRRRDG